MRFIHRDARSCPSLRFRSWTVFPSMKRRWRIYLLVLTQKHVAGCHMLGVSLGEDWRGRRWYVSSMGQRHTVLNSCWWGVESPLLHILKKMERPNNTKSNGVKQHLIVVLTYVFLITNEVEYFFPMFYCPFCRHLSPFFAHFSIRLPVHCVHNWFLGYS